MQIQRFLIKFPEKNNFNNKDILLYLIFSKYTLS